MRQQLKIIIISFLIFLQGCEKWSYEPVNFIEVTTDAVSSNRLNSVTVCGRIKMLGKGTVKRYGHFFSSENEAPSENDLKTETLEDVVEPIPFCHDLNDLDFGKQYFIRSFAEDDTGRKFYGNTVSFITGNLVLTMDSVLVRNIDDISVLGSIVGLGQEEVAEAHGFCYWSADSQEPAANEQFISLGERRGSGVITGTLTEVIPATNYHIRSFADYQGVRYFSENALQFNIRNIWIQRKAVGNGFDQMHGGVSFILDNEAYLGIGFFHSIVNRPYGFSDQSRIWKFDNFSKEWSEQDYFPGRSRMEAVSFVIDEKSLHRYRL